MSVAAYFLAALTAGAGFAAIYIPLNMVIRWWLHRHRAGSAGGSAEPARPILEPDQAQELISRLHEVAARLARDVGQHTDTMDKVNSQLQAVNPADGHAAIQAVVHAVEKVAQANSDLTGKLSSAQETIREQSVLLEAQMQDALTDALTGIANRRAFDYEMQRRYADWQRRRTPVSLAMLDVDHFKGFNDQHGHQAGDEVLRGVAKTLSQSMREVDLVARYGGEEFSMIFPDTDQASAKLAVDRARQAVAASQYPFEQRVLHVTTSAGLAQLHAGEDIAGLIRRADAALYASKQSGRNCSYYHDGKRCIPIGPRSKAATTGAGEPRPAEKAQQAAPPAAPAPSTPVASATYVDTDSTDPLTQLATRPVLLDNLRRRLAEKRRRDMPLALVAFQLDDFGRLAELGTRATEFVIGASARILEGVSRKMDLVVRTGESQFALMLPNSDLMEAITPAERVRHAVASCEKLKHHGAVVRFTMSSGAADAFEDDDEISLLERAEAAMRQAAGRGGNRTYVHNGSTCEPVSRPALA
ncbi:MAG: hypothetical protein A2W31_15040 [Planctomycetes bacterium RBG_16_64_10]|nr:MAG: hypothetical protein A2W31_15040 [Planctomycetes bacterium RBG_16_64_10]